MQGATTLCESWECTTYSSAGSSMNHIMFGGFDEYMYSSFGGLSTISNATVTGWELVLVQPTISALLILKTVNTSIFTRFGQVTLLYSYDPNTQSVTYSLDIPVGTSALVSFPQIMDAMQINAVFYSEFVGKSYLEKIVWKIGDSVQDYSNLYMQFKFSSGSYKIAAHYVAL